MRYHFRLATGFLFLVLGISAHAAGLNDTGVTQCLNAAGSALEACAPANSGAAGFDFTPLDASGNAIPISGGVPAGTPACERDNVTGLILEVKTPGNTGWRVPTRRELLPIVHLGVNSPSIDGNYFPNTQSGGYWSSDVYTPLPAGAWIVNFSDGSTIAYFQTSDYYAAAW